MSNNNEPKNNINTQDIFSEYLYFNNFQNDINNEDFPKPNFDSFDKFNNSIDENSIKSINSLSEFKKSNNLNKSHNYEYQSQISRKIINHNNFENNKKISFNGQNEINIMRDINKENQFLSRKKAFNLIQNKELSEKEIKQKKLKMNRESAKKSRLKKKVYLENLEKQYFLLKTEYIKIIESEKVNKAYSNNFIQKEENFSKDDKITPYFKIGKENVLYECKINKEDNINNNNNYFSKQKKVMENILVNQIDMLTPLNIKSLQNKFLKLNKLDNNDNFQTIKNKIISNLETIKELYDISENDNNQNKQSKGYQLFDFYQNILLLLNKYEIIQRNIENINSI